MGDLKKYVGKVEQAVKRLKKFADDESVAKLKHWEAVLTDVKNVVLKRKEAERTTSESDRRCDVPR